MEVKDIEIIDKATEFENRKHVYKSTNEKIVASLSLIHISEPTRQP